MKNFRQNKKLQKRILIGAGIIGLLICLSSTGTFYGSMNSGVTSGTTNSEFTSNSKFQSGITANTVADNGTISNNAESKDVIVDNEPIQEVTGDKIIYTSNVSIQTLKYEESMEEIDKLISKYKCIVQSESERDNNYDWYNGSDDETGTLHSNLVIRVPSKNFQTFIDGLDDVGKITNKEVSSDNITKQYNSTEITIESLEIQKNRLLKFMKEANSVSEMLEIESKLTDVERRLNEAKSSLEQMDTDIEYSSIYVSIDEVYKYDDRLDEDTFINRLINTIKDSFDGFLKFIENTLFGLILVLPYLLVISVVGILVVKIYKKKKKEISNRMEKEVNDEEISTK